MTASSDIESYYDPFDTEIDKDPHRVWQVACEMKHRCITTRSTTSLR